MRHFIHFSLFFFCFSLIGQDCYAQNAYTIDSLKAQLEVSTTATEKAKILYAISSEYNRNPDSSLLYAGMAFSEAQQSEDSTLVFEIGTSAMYAHSYFDHSVEIIEIGESLLPYEKQVPDTAIRLSFLNTLGGLGYSATGESQKQLDLLEYALQMVYQSPTYIKSATVLLSNLVSGYFSVGRSNAAAVWVEKVKHSAEQLKDSVAYSNILLLEGRIAFANNDGKLGLACYQESNLLATARKDTIKMIESLYDLGQAYMDFSQYDSAITYLNRAIELQTNIEDEANLMFLEFLLGKAYCQAHDYPKALPHILKPQAFFQQTGNRIRLVDVHAVLGQVLVGNGDSRKGMNLLLSAADSARALGYQYGLQKVFTALAESYQMLGDWKNVSACKDTLLVLKDLEFRTSQEEIRRQIEIQEENQRKQLENSELTMMNLELSEKSRKRTFFLILILMVSVIIAIISIALRNKWKYEQRQNAELDRKVTQQTAHLSESIRQATEANEDLRKFTFLASHTFKTSIRTVKSMADLLKKKTAKKAPEYLSFLDLIAKAGVDMNNTLDSLTAYFELRESEIRLSSVDLSRLCSSLAEKVWQRYPEKQAIIRCKGLDTIHGNEKELALMLIHLIDNAIKYQPEGQKPEVIMSGEENATGYEFRITDNGLGISPKYQEQIFEAFTRLHPSSSYEGVGIGLAIIKRIVDRHQATIRVESQPEEGSTFIIQFPKFPDSPQR